MPLGFIVTMRRTAAEKILLFLVLAAGLGATVAATVRAITLLGSYGQYPVAWLNVRTDLLCSLEMFLGLIGANLPCLKGPTHRLLIRARLMSSSVSDPSFSSVPSRLSQRRYSCPWLLRIASSVWEDKESLPSSDGVRL